MFNLADILAQAQGNRGLEAISRQFGLSPDQIQAAMTALLPAFTVGLNRASQSPAAMADLFGLFARAPNTAQMFDNPAAAMPAMMSAGQEVLARLFGSPDLTQAIAKQTAAMTGLGQDMMRQMMPLTASMLMGGLVKGAMDGQNPLAPMLASVFAAMTPKSAPAGPAEAIGSLMDACTEAFRTMMGGKPPQSTASAVPGLDQMMELARRMQAANPLLNGHGATGPAAPPEASGPRSLGQQAADTWTATLGRMFEHGRGLQEQQLAQIEQLFDQFAQKPKS
jgi:hypothetical protein